MAGASTVVAAAAAALKIEFEEGGAGVHVDVEFTPLLKFTPLQKLPLY